MAQLTKEESKLMVLCHFEYYPIAITRTQPKRRGLAQGVVVSHSLRLVEVPRVTASGYELTRKQPPVAPDAIEGAQGKY